MHIASKIPTKRQASKIGAYLFSVPYDHHKFKSLKHEVFYSKLESHLLIMERKVQLSSSRVFLYGFVQEIDIRSWGIFA